jgi:hypothetical protein
MIVFLDDLSNYTPGTKASHLAGLFVFQKPDNKRDFYKKNQ